MLSTTKVSVKQVSVACGFESVHYFHRAFKKRIDITPKHYQNFKLSMKGSIPVEEKPFTLDGLSLDSDFSGTVEIIDGEIFLHGSDASLSDFLGYQLSVLKDKPFLNFISQEDIEIAKEAVNSIVEGRNVIDVAVNLSGKAGSPLRVEFTAISKGNTLFWFMKKAFIDD
jgi:hypothetical protein